MRMTEAERKMILERGKFLEEKGYIAKPDDYGVDYFNGEIKIMAYYERYENSSGVDIKFPGNYHFQLGWIALVREALDTKGMGVLEKILALMDFLERNFEKVIAYEYCDESYLMVDEYIEKKRRENPDAFPVRGISYAEGKEEKKKLNKRS